MNIIERSERIELLAPGGDTESIRAAILAGADAVYVGLNKFNARNRAKNISLDELYTIIKLAHSFDCRVYLTINILILESEIPDVIRVLNRLINSGIDGLIVQDTGLLYILLKYYPGFDIHASTQMTTHNEGQLKFLKRLKVSRVNLSRELNIEEIRNLCSAATENEMQTEVFVHGSYCISFSGICYMSSFLGGKSGNRGQCSQQCRDQYEKTSAGWTYPLNLKDNSALDNLEELAAAGVSSLKIEGRIKDFEYVHRVVSVWRDQLVRYYKGLEPGGESDKLKTVFNRRFTNGYLLGDISRDMFIDDPRNQSLSQQDDPGKFLKDKEINRRIIIRNNNSLSLGKIPVEMYFSGTAGQPMLIRLLWENNEAIVQSRTDLTEKGSEVLGESVLFKKFSGIVETAYEIKNIDTQNLYKSAYLSFKEIKYLRNRVFAILNEGREYRKPVSLPQKPEKPGLVESTRLAVLVSEPGDIESFQKDDLILHLQLPDSLSYKYNECKRVLSEFPATIPVFPSILIGQDYHLALQLIHELEPKEIITNNTGIAQEAWRRGIRWIAGPKLNLTNSYALQCLKDVFGCSGAFISNELNHFQIKSISRPEDFELYFNILNPMELMTSRQCFFHQVEGCNKNGIDDSCISSCSKKSSIMSMDGRKLIIEKTRGNYNRILDSSNYLNLEIVEDLKGQFSGFQIDVSGIKTDTGISLDKSHILRLFINYLDGDKTAISEIIKCIQPAGNKQYLTGIL